MRILLLNQFFWPDSSATSQLLTDVARGLAAEGHEVSAICSASGGYAVRADAQTEPAVKVHRVAALPFGRGPIGRVLSYGTFYVAALARALFLPKQDVILSLTTPPLLSLIALLVKRVRGSRYFVWEMDMYPDVAVDLGYFKRGGIADRFVGLLADASRRNADGIIALGDCMKTRLAERGVVADRVHVADNWADGAAITPLPRPGSADELVLLYSGNLGLAHDLETITSAMTALRADQRFRFLFVGSGAQRETLANIVRERHLSKVELRPYVQRSSLSENLALGDIGLVTQRAVCCGSVVPSKVYGLLAAGRPILFIGPAEARPARIIEEFGCGWHVPDGDSDALRSLLLRLVERRDEVALAGERARTALVQHFDLPHGVSRILSIVRATGSMPSSVLVDSLHPSAADSIGISH